MPKVRKLTAGIAAAAAVAVVADPPVGSHNKAVVPASYDVVGVGANTDANKTAIAAIAAYGFLATTTCGSGS